MTYPPRCRFSNIKCPIPLYARISLQNRYCWWNITSSYKNLSCAVMGEHKSEVFRNSHGPRPIGCRSMVNHPSVSGFTTLKWYTKHYVQFNSDCCTHCFTDNKEHLWCTITNSHDAQSQTTVMQNYRPESLIHRRLFKHFVPYKSASWYWQYEVTTLHAGKGSGRRFSKHTTSGFGNRRSVRGTDGIQRRISFCYDGFGGLVVSMLASGTKVCGFKPGRSRWIFRT